MWEGAFDVPHSWGWTPPLSSADSCRWVLLWTCLRIISHCVLQSGPDLKSEETFTSGSYIFKDLRTFWWTPVNVCGTVWFMGCTPSDFPVDWRVNEVEVCPSSLCINQIEISCAKRLLHALHLLIRRVWWGSGSWQSLWSCDCPFRCGIEHWMPCESCKPGCGLWGPLLDPWERFPRREDGSKAGRPQCNGFKSEIALNWTLGLIPVHEHGSWRGYKNTGSLFLGEGGGCQCLRMSCLYNSRSLPCGGLAQTCDVWIKITHSLGVVWFSGSV